MGKKLLTFLGAGDYKEITYLREEDNLEENYKNMTTKFIQEALVNALGKDTEVYIFLTEYAKKRHWEPENEENKPGLRKIFEDEGIKYKTIDIYDGKSNEELWDNFDKIYSCFSDGDEIAIDITHSFRSIPIIFLGVLNYAKETKNIKVNGIYYGAFEASKDTEFNGNLIKVAPIFDLTLFNTLHKWSIGINNFFKSGDAIELCNAMDESVNHIIRNKKNKEANEAKMFKNLSLALKKFSENLIASRGQLISKSGIELKNKIEQNKNIGIKELKPFKNIINKLYECVEDFSGDMVNDTIIAIKLCKRFNLIQQAYTFLQELIITKICIVLNKSISSVEDRNSAKDIICIASKSNDNTTDYYEIGILYNNISQYRNDINHGGFNQGAHKMKDFKEKLDVFLDEFIKFEKIYIEEEFIYEK